ncbi:MAG: biotin/lipoyl-containing protein [Sandaracinaceae bacterium]
MKYRVTIDGEARDVDVVIAPDGRGVSVSLDGEPQEVDVVRVPGGLSMRIGGRVFDLAVGGKPESTQLAAGGARALAEVLSDRMRAKRERAGGSLGGGGTEIRAPMPGRVVKILVAKGQAVEAGDPSIVIEAMKMENELRAPVSGTVAEVLVSEGAAVEGGVLLVRFDVAG